MRTSRHDHTIFYIRGHNLLPVARLFAYAYCMEHMPHPDTAFKILTAAQWAQFMADGVFHGAPVDLADGYIHLSTQDQVQGTLDSILPAKRIW